MAVTVNVVRGLAALLRDRGVPIARFLEEAGLGREVLEQPLAPQDESAVQSAVQAAYRLTGDAALGLHLGMSVPPGMFSVAGQLLLSCPTIRAALHELERYMPLFLTASTLRLQEHGERASIVFEPSGVLESSPFITELTLTFVLRVGRQFVSECSAPIAVYVRHPAPPYASLYEAVFGCPTHFSAPRDELVFQSRMLDVAQPFADEPLRILMRHRAEDLLVSSSVRDSVHARVRIALLRDPSLADVDSDSVARRVGMTPRSLRRKLRQEGVLLSDLVDELRREIALRELLHRDTPIKQIADRLGFSEVSAFHRAFKRWTTLTPAKYRAQGGLSQAS